MQLARASSEKRHASPPELYNVEAPHLQAALAALTKAGELASSSLNISRIARSCRASLPAALARSRNVWAIGSSIGISLPDSSKPVRKRNQEATVKLSSFIDPPRFN